VYQFPSIAPVIVNDFHGKVALVGMSVDSRRR